MRSLNIPAAIFIAVLVLSLAVGALALATLPQLTAYSVALAVFTGTSSMLIGLAWPLVILLYRNTGEGVRLIVLRGNKAGLLVLLLAALYGFTLYLKASLSILDALILLMLFGAYVWTALRRQVGAAEATPLAWSVAERATAALITCQIVLLTLLIAALPVAYTLHGFIMGDAGSLPIDDRGRSALLVTSAQALFLVVLLAKTTASARSALALLVLFSLQATLTVIHPGGQSTLAPTLLAIVYLGAATALVSRDPSRLHDLLGVAPGDGARPVSQPRVIALTNWRTSPLVVSSDRCPTPHAPSERRPDSVSGDLSTGLASSVLARRGSPL